MKNPEIKSITKLIQRISLALPIIIGLLWIVLSAALASDHYDVGSHAPCIPGQPPVVREQIRGQEYGGNGAFYASRPDLSPKTLYWGRYHTLNLMEKIKIKTAPAVNPAAFDFAAIAFVFPFGQLASVAEENDCWPVIYDLITRGRLALAVQVDQEIEILPSDDIFRALLETSDDSRAAYEMYGIVPQTTAYEAWLSDWADLIPSDARPSLPNILGVHIFHQSSQTSTFPVPGAATDDVVHRDDVFAISPEKNLFGIEPKERLITWDGVHTFPALAVPSP